jgi:hypothetical protein
MGDGGDQGKRGDRPIRDGKGKPLSGPDHQPTSSIGAHPLAPELLVGKSLAARRSATPASVSGLDGWSRSRGPVSERLGWALAFSRRPNRTVARPVPSLNTRPRPRARTRAARVALKSEVGSPRVLMVRRRTGATVPAMILLQWVSGVLWRQWPHRGLLQRIVGGATVVPQPWLLPRTPLAPHYSMAKVQLY